MFISSNVNQSFTHEFTTAESLTGGAFTAVSLTENAVVTAGASSIPVGILTGGNELPIDAGESVTTQIAGGGLWIIGGESVAVGDFLTSGENGTAVKAQAGDFAFARALKNASTSSAVEVQIINKI